MSGTIKNDNLSIQSGAVLYGPEKHDVEYGIAVT